MSKKVPVEYSQKLHTYVVTGYSDENITDSGAELVRNAIVMQAFEDYKDAIKGKRVDHKPPKWVMEECEKFFRSDYFYQLTNGRIDPDAIIKRSYESVIDDYEVEIQVLQKKIDKVKRMMNKEENK